MMKRIIPAGSRVWLPPSEDSPAEIGTVLVSENVSGCYLVEVDQKFRDDLDRDGLREIPHDGDCLFTAADLARVVVELTEVE